MEPLTPEKQRECAQRLRNFLMDIAREFGIEEKHQPDITGCFILWKFETGAGDATILGNIYPQEIEIALSNLIFTSVQVIKHEPTNKAS